MLISCYARHKGTKQSMKHKNKFLEDFAAVVFSNGLVLVSNILTGLVVPKLLGVNNYGYYKVYTLYLVYVALLHFGFVDGILLKHGGEQYDQLDKKKFRLNTRFFSALQMLVAVVIMACSYFFEQPIYRFICVMLGIDTIFTNLTSYYQYVSQCTMRFKELSFRRILQAILKSIIVVAFWIIHRFGMMSVLSAYVYITCLVVIDFLLLLWYVHTYRDITFGSRARFKDNKKDLIAYFKSGIILTVAFQVANLVFSLDRQFVSVLFDNGTYGIYSFAYSLISMATTVIGAVSLVLFPNLKRKSEDKIISDFTDSMGIIEVLVFAAHMVYYPLCWFVNWYLPEYSASLPYLQLLFPGLAISSCISVIIFTYYKVLDKNLLYFGICVCVLALSALLNGGAYLVFGTPFSISAVSLIALMVWYLLSERYFIKKYHVKWKKNLAYIIVMSSLFYAITYIIHNSIIGTVLYVLAFAIVTIIFYGKMLKKRLRMI